VGQVSNLPILMVGPLFEFEWLRVNQQGRLDLLRRVYAFILILEMLALDSGETGAVYAFAQRWIYLFLVQQFALIVILTPVFLAGAIGDEKSRGSLQFLLITDLNSWEILAGRCVGRLSQVLAVLSPGLPLLCFTSVLAGFPFTTALLLALFTVALVFALAGVSALAAVWTRQTRQAVATVYLTGGSVALTGWAIARLVPRVPALAGVLPLFRLFDLAYIFAPAWDQPDPSEFGRRLFLAALVWLSVGMTALLIAVWRLRPAYLKQIVARARPRRWLQRAEPTDQPIRWKEANVERPVSIPIIGAAPSWLVAVVFFAVMLGWSGFSLAQRMDHRILSLQQSVVVLFFASLMIGIRASGTVTGEREHNTWDMLLTTPLETDELLRGKLQGILDAMMPFLAAYAMFALIPAVVMRDLVAGALTVMALAATWLAMYLLGAAGILSSVRAQSSGQSLLNMLITGYGLSNLRACFAGSPITFLVASTVFGVSVAIAHQSGGQPDMATIFVCMVGLAVCLAIGPGLALWRRAQDYLDSAVMYIDKRERLRQRRDDDALGRYAEYR
jgi:ABC-type transport system involved in multi-copper enzyme maturation permease subunit